MVGFHVLSGVEEVNLWSGQWCRVRLWGQCFRPGDADFRFTVSALVGATVL